MMQITLVDSKGVPKTLPMDQAQMALSMGAKYASEADKQKAIEYGNSFEGFIKSGFNKINNGSAVNTGEQIPVGAKEELQKMFAGLTGRSFAPSAVPNKPGASLGRGLGSLTTQLGVLAPIGLGAEALAGPLVGIGAEGLATGLTTPGDLEERGKAAAINMAIPTGFYGANKAIKGISKKAIDLKSFIKTVRSNPEPEKALESAISRHDSLQNTAKELFDTTKQDLASRGVTKIPVSENIMKKVSARLDDTPEHKALFNAAKKGDPSALHDVQSFLWKEGDAAAASEDPAIRRASREIFSLRNELNEDVQNILSRNGHLDLVHRYKQAQGLWKELQDTYYDYNKIANVFNPKLRKIPENVSRYFGENSEPINEFLKVHPEIRTEIEALNSKQEAMKLLKKYGIRAGTIGSSLYGGYKLLE